MIDTQNYFNGLELNNTNTHYVKREVTTQNNIAAKASEELVYSGLEEKRQTYGLAILELMSDQEYEAWLRATAGMTETEKMLAVQKLYPLADIQKIRSAKGKIDVDNEQASQGISTKPFVINANKLNGIKMYNSNSDFIQRYKNAFENLHINVESVNV